MRKCFKEHFPEPVKPVVVKKSDEEETPEVAEMRPTHPFASRVPRFQDVQESGVFRRKKKTKPTAEVVRKNFSAFGSSSKRDFLVTRNPVASITPGVGAYTINKEKRHFFKHSFGGDAKIEPAFKIICGYTHLDSDCSSCEEKVKNVYWKSKKTQENLCRRCYKKRVQDIKTKTRGIVDKMRKLMELETDFEKTRYCDFYHKHESSTAAVKILSPREIKKRMTRENYLNTLLNY